jgi:hypothetical protein
MAMGTRKHRQRQDLSVDVTVHEIVRDLRKIGAQRFVLDSLVGFEMALVVCGKQINDYPASHGRA